MAREGIRRWKNAHKGERVFLIGNGPSLTKTPLEKLSDEYTITTNKINKIFGNTRWRPDYYLLSSQSGTIKSEDVRDVLEAGTTCFVNEDREDDLDGRPNLYDLTVEFPGNDPRTECFGDPHVPEKSEGFWSDEIHEHVYLYNTSIFPLYQLANYMGCNEIYLLGCDLGMDVDELLFEEGDSPYEFIKDNNISLEGKLSISMFSKLILNSSSPIKTLLNVLYVSPILGINLFKRGKSPYELSSDDFDTSSPRISRYYKFVLDSQNRIPTVFNGVYFKFFNRVLKSTLFHDPHFSGYGSGNLTIGEDDRQRRAHRLAKEKLTHRNVEVYNATLGGELDIFQRVKLDEIIGC